jgi:hypothetical protein
MEAGKRAALACACGAVMFSVPAAACGQTRISVRSERKERRDEGETERGQQQNGEKFPHWLD